MSNRTASSHSKVQGTSLGPTCSMHFTSTGPFPALRRFPTTERVQTRNISEQMCLEQICLGACQYFSIPLSHVHQGKQRCIVLLFYGRRNVLEAGSVSNLYCWRHEREWVRVREGVLKVDPPKEHILVGQMTHQQGVITRCLPLPLARVSSFHHRRTNFKKIFSHC